MKIDTELRRAITAMAKRQPEQTWQQKEEANKKAIADFFAAKPSAKRKVEALIRKAVKADKDRNEAGQSLCRDFGLRMDSYEIGTEIVFARCDSENGAFIKAGGVPPSKHPDKWTIDSVIAQLTKATPQDGAEILRRIGVNWE
jgi:hypothetical protein